jgi:hypothetical protein
LSNQTTLETLELKRQGKNPDDEVSEYNLGKAINIKAITTIGCKYLAGTPVLGGFQSSFPTRDPQEMESFGRADLSLHLFDSIFVPYFFKACWDFQYLVAVFEFGSLKQSFGGSI